MPKTLAIDTTGTRRSIALLDGDRLIEALSMPAPDGFRDLLFSEIADLLERHHLHLQDIDCFAAATGPGSFTGVRAGLGAAKGFAETLGKPIVGVSNLKAMAAHGSGPLRATLLDARRGEIFGAVYSAELEIVQPEIVTRLPAWLDGLPPQATIYTLDPAPFAEVIGDRFPVVTISGYNAAAIGTIAAAEWAAGRAQDPAAIDANYVRRADAEMNWTDR